MSSLRIALCGPSGTGKSTLAKHISEEFGIPFITTSTKELWEKHRIYCHSDIIKRTVNEPQWGYEFQVECLQLRLEKVREYPEFVTDRSPLDNWVYFLLQCSPFLLEAQCDNYLSLCQEAMRSLTGLIYLPYTTNVQLENDGKRINNGHYQKLTGYVFDNARRSFHMHSADILMDVTIPEWAWKLRTEEANRYINYIKA